MLDLFAGDRAAGDQFAPAREIGLRPGQLDFAQLHVGAGLADVGVLRAHLPHGACELRLGARQRQLGIGVIELDQALPALT